MHKIIKCPSRLKWGISTSSLRRFPAVLLAASLCLSTLPTCAGITRDVSPVCYDATADTYTVAGRPWTNLFEWSTSPSGNYLIYVASQFDEEPEAYLYDRETGTHRQLTQNSYLIESQVRTDDSGNWALMLTGPSHTRSKLLYNGETVADGKLLNRSLCLWKGKLFYATWDLASMSTGLFLYDPEAKETKTIIYSLPISTGLSIATGDAILLEAYDIVAKANTVLSVCPEVSEEARVKTLSSRDSFLLPSDEIPQILQISGDTNAKYLFNSYYWLDRYQSGEPWSGSPDSTGRVSWNMSFRLLDMMELWEKTKDPALCSQISTAIHRLIATRKVALQSNGEVQDGFLFASKIFSLDHQTELRLMVNNAMIYWPMLRAANAGLLEEGDCQTLLAMAKAVFQYYEEDWDSAVGCYRFRKGEPFYLDGAVLPFNQQNAFGLCLIELWKATGNSLYRNRCSVLAKTFHEELKITEDKRTIWHYWPQIFYDGWTEEDSISVNNPVHAPQTPSYEDTAHAAMNAAFMLEYYYTFQNIFSPTEIRGVRRTLDAICTGSNWSTVLEPIDANMWYFSSLWAKYISPKDRNKAFAQYLLSTDTFSLIEYDNQNSLAFARLYDPKAEGTLQAFIFSYEDSALHPLEETHFSLSEIASLAERFRTVPIT